MFASKAFIIQLP